MVEAEPTIIVVTFQRVVNGGLAQTKLKSQRQRRLSISNLRKLGVRRRVDSEFVCGSSFDRKPLKLGLLPARVNVDADELPGA